MSLTSIMDAFYAFNQRNIPADLPSGYGDKAIDLICDFYWSNKAKKQGNDLNQM